MNKESIPCLCYAFLYQSFELNEKCKSWFNFVHVLIFLASQGNIWNYLSLSFADFLSQFYFSVCRADLIQHQYRAAGTSEHLGSTIQISNGLPIFKHKCLWHIIQWFVKFWIRNITSYLFDYFTIVSSTAQTDKKVLTANIFESGPMPTPWKSLDRTASKL